MEIPCLEGDCRIIHCQPAVIKALWSLIYHGRVHLAQTHLRLIIMYIWSAPAHVTSDVAGQTLLLAHAALDPPLPARLWVGVLLDTSGKFYLLGTKVKLSSYQVKLISFTRLWLSLQLFWLQIQSQLCKKNFLFTLRWLTTDSSSFKNHYVRKKKILLENLPSFSWTISLDYSKIAYHIGMRGDGEYKSEKWCLEELQEVVLWLSVGAETALIIILYY